MERSLSRRPPLMGSGLFFTSCQRPDPTPRYRQSGVKATWGQVSTARESIVPWYSCRTRRCPIRLLLLRSFTVLPMRRSRSTPWTRAGIDSEIEDVRLKVQHEDAYRAYGVLDTAWRVVE